MSSNYNFLSTGTTILEKQNMILFESIYIVRTANQKLQSPREETGKAMYKK